MVNINCKYLALCEVKIYTLNDKKFNILKRSMSLSSVICENVMQAN